MVFRQKTVFVGGKGGVGKSVVSAAIAAVRSQTSDSTQKPNLLIQIGQSRAFDQIFEQPIPPATPIQISPQLWCLTLDLNSIAHEFLQRHLPISSWADKICASDVFKYWTEATPMLAEVLLLGKIWKLATDPEHGAEKWQKIVVETPATGHGIALLMAGKKANQMLVGPMKSNSEAIVEWISDPDQCCYTLVAIPEQLAVKETIDLCQQAQDDVEIHVESIILNGCCPPLSQSEQQTQRSADSLHPFIAKALNKSAEQRDQIQHFKELLQQQTARFVAELPWLPVLSIHAPEITQLAVELQSSLTNIKGAQQP